MSINVTTPDGMDPSTFYDMGGMGSGVLCDASGPVSYPSGSCAIGVYGSLNPASPPGSADDVVAGNIFESRSQSDTSWDLSQRFVNAVTGANNNLYVVNEYSEFGLDPNTGMFAYTVTQEGPVHVAFTGQPSNQPCPLGAKGGHGAERGPRKLGVMGQEVHPVAREGEWLHYAHINPGATGLGSVLMLNGKYLSARLIAVVATDICWWHGDGHRQIVNRAIGDAKPVPPLVWTLVEASDDTLSLKPKPSPFVFPDVMQCGIVVSHMTKNFNRRHKARAEDGPRTVVLDLITHSVTAECREHANLFSVDHNYPLFVQVNYNTTERSQRTGAYSLWVKVIE